MKNAMLSVDWWCVMFYVSWFGREPGFGAGWLASKIYAYCV